MPVLRDADRMSFAEIEQADPRLRQARRGRHADARGPEGRHVHDHQRRRLRLAAEHADPEPAAGRHPRPAQDPGAPGRRERPGRDPADDVRRAHLRPPHRRRPRGGAVPGARQGTRRRSRARCCSNSEAWTKESQVRRLFAVATFLVVAACAGSPSSPTPASPPSVAAMGADFAGYWSGIFFYNACAGLHCSGKVERTNPFSLRLRQTLNHVTGLFASDTRQRRNRRRRSTGRLAQALRCGGHGRHDRGARHGHLRGTGRSSRRVHWALRLDAI